MAEGGGGVLRELLAVFGFKVETDELEKGENALTKFAEHAKHAVEGFVVALGVEKIFEFAEANVHAMAQIEHSAVRLGISADKVQEFQFAAKSLGLEAESLINMMGRLQVTQQAAADGGAQQSKAFHDIGVKVKDTNGHMKSADELFTDVAEGIHNIKDPTKQAAVAVHLFGRQGRELLPFLKEGKKGIEELGEEYRKLGGGYTEEAIEQSKKFERQSAKMGLAWKGLKSTIMSALLPPLTWVISKISSAVGWFKQLTDGSRLFEIAFAALGAVMVAWAAPMLLAAAPILLLVGALAAFALIVNSVIRMFEGKQSAVGDFIDKLFGEGSSTDLVKELKEDWWAVKEQVKASWEFLKQFWDILQPITKKMGELMANMLTIGDTLRNGFGSLGGAGVGKIAMGDVQGAVGDAQQRIAMEAAMAPERQGWVAPPPMLAAGQYSNDVTITNNWPEGVDPKQASEHQAHQIKRVLAGMNRESKNTRRVGKSQ